MGDANDTLKVGEFLRTIERVERTQQERVTDLKTTLTDGLDRIAEQLTRHDDTLVAHAIRIAALEHKPAPLATTTAQVVTAQHPAEEGVIKITASKATWAMLAALFGVVQTVLIFVAKQAGWVK